MRTLGQMLKLLRTSKADKPTQEDVAKAVGVPRATYANWEIDRGEPSNDLLVSLANYYKVSIDYLLGKTDTPKTTTSDELSNEDLEGLMYLRLSKSKLPDAIKEQFIKGFKEDLKLIKELEKKEFGE